MAQDSVSGVDCRTSPTNLDRFSVRRGRLKATYAGENAEYMLQIDATGDGVVLKDAEATFVDTWTPFNFRLTAGQFKVPFGYEVLQSSADREMPERARSSACCSPASAIAACACRPATSGCGSGRAGERQLHAATRSTARGTRTATRTSICGSAATSTSSWSACRGSGARSWRRRVAQHADHHRHEHGRHHPGERDHAPDGRTNRLFGLWRAGADAQFYVDVPRSGAGAQGRGHPVEATTTGTSAARSAKPVPRPKRPRLDPHRRPEHRRPPGRRGLATIVESEPRRSKRGATSGRPA